MPSLTALSFDPHDAGERGASPKPQFVPRRYNEIEAFGWLLTRTQHAGARGERRILCVCPRYTTSFGMFEHAYPLLDGVRALKWLNVEDFAKALSVARQRFPEPPPKIVPPEERVLGLIETVLMEPSSKETKRTTSKETGSKETSVKEDSVAAPKPQLHKFDMRIEGSIAKFVPQWRIRVKR